MPNAELCAKKLSTYDLRVARIGACLLQIMFVYIFMFVSIVIILVLLVLTYQDEKDDDHCVLLL